MAKIAIVGGGTAGLSAGIYALKAGYDAEIIESHRLAGGNLTGWYRKGLYIDNCIHWLTGTNPNTREYGVWKELGVITSANGVVQPEKLYSYKSEEGTLSLYSDIDRTGAEMLQISPADEKRIFSFVDAVKKLMNVMGVGGENSSQKAGNFEVLLSAPKILAYHLKSVGDFAKKFDNRLIRRFFTCFIGEEFGSLALLFVFATFCGSNGGVLRCGSLGAAKAMSEEFLRLGGKLTLGKRAEEVYEEEGGACVRLEDGQIIKADYALLAADAKTIFGKLVNSAMPARLKRAYREMKTFSAFQCAFKCRSEDIPFVGDIIIDLSEEEQKILGSDNLVLRTTPHIPESRSGEWEVLQATVFIEREKAYEFIACYDEKSAYKSKKEQFIKFIRAAAARNFPFIGESELLDAWTPATYKKFTGEPTGAFMSFVVPPKFIPFRISPKLRGTRRIFVASQWYYPPGGLPNAVAAGRAAIDKIRAGNRLKVQILRKKAISPDRVKG